MRMAARCLPAILLVLAAAAPPVVAETYKWVDAKGVVNYSSSPPPAVAAKAKLVEERISIIGPDPSLGPAIAAMRARAARQAQYDEADWQRRQQYLLAAQTSYAPAYGSGYGPYAYSSPYPYYAPVFVASAARRVAPFFFARPPASQSGGRGGVRSGRSGFR